MTILITGGTKGIGLAIAKRLACKDVNLALAYHADDEAAAAAKCEIDLMGGVATPIRADIGSVEGCSALMEAIGALGNGLRHIVHSAATIYPTSMLDADPAAFARAVETNGLSLLYLVQKALPLLGRGSSIVFITSAGARAVISPTYGALGAGKALAEAIMRYLVPELAPRGIRIAPSPGRALHQAIDRLTDIYRFAVEAGHEPKENWLQPIDLSKPVYLQ